MNQKAIKWIQEKYDIEKTIGEGQIGIAFLTKDGKVLKLTTSQKEFEIAKKMSKSKAYAPLAEIYEAYKLPNVNVFAILKEKLKPLNEIQQYIFDDSFELLQITQELEDIFEMTIENITLNDVRKLYSESIEKAKEVEKAFEFVGLTILKGSPPIKDVFKEINFIQKNKDLIQQSAAFLSEIANYNINDIKGDNVGISQLPTNKFVGSLTQQDEKIFILYRKMATLNSHFVRLHVLFRHEHGFKNNCRKSVGSNSVF